jgi:ferric-dicitrate binding protein FerR (iron transport regulator)
MSHREGEQDLDALLKRALPRQEPPVDVRTRVLAAVEQEWQQYKRRRWRLPAALAATVLMAVVTGLLIMRPTAAVEVRISDTGGLWVDGILHDTSGVVLSIGRGVSLEAAGGTRLVAGHTELRLREGTRIKWLEPGAVDLERGSIYVDTRGRSRLRVHTPLGVVSDVGTTFMVTLDGDAMEVAMRDGTTMVDTPHGSYTARAGDHYGDVVTVSPERLSARAEPASAERWQWIHAVHPGYSRRDVVPLLQAIAADLGMALEFASPAVEAAALRGRLDGDLSGLAPAQALKVVLATTGLARRRSTPDRLIIEFHSRDD